MAGNQHGSSIMASRHSAARPGTASPTISRGGATHDLGWIPIALGGAAIVAGLGGRRRGAAALALSAVAGAGALGAMRSTQTGHATVGRAPEVERSITIGKSADELRQYWLDPGTLPQIMSGFATVRATGAGHLHWKIEGPLGRACEWVTETVDRPGDGLGWRALSDGAVSNEGWIRFHSAPAGRGTVVTLRLRFEPPGGAFGEWLLELLGTIPLRMVADGALRRFKNLVETGEIPTTVRQPAARADTH